MRAVGSSDGVEIEDGDEKKESNGEEELVKKLETTTIN